MKILLVDDQSMAFSDMTRLLAKVPGYHVVGYARNGFEAIKKVADLRPDIVILDIRMPECDGLTAADEMNRLKHPPSLIFVSAVRKYTMRALDVHAAGYLLKPVRLDRLRETLHYVSRTSRLALRNVAEGSGDYVCCRTSGGLRMVDISQVPYLQAKNKYTELVYSDRRVLSSRSLIYFERQHGELLVRARRDVLINPTFVLGLNRISHDHHVVVLKGIAETIRVSRRYSSQVRAALSKLLPAEQMPEGEAKAPFEEPPEEVSKGPSEEMPEEASEEPSEETPKEASEEEPEEEPEEDSEETPEASKKPPKE